MPPPPARLRQVDFARCPRSTWTPCKVDLSTGSSWLRSGRQIVGTGACAVAAAPEPTLLKENDVFLEENDVFLKENDFFLRKITFFLRTIAFILKENHVFLKENNVFRNFP